MVIKQYRSWTSLAWLVGVASMLAAVSVSGYLFYTTLYPEAPATVVNLPDGMALKVGDTAPDFAIADLAGKTVRLSDYRGKAVLLKLWSTECFHCVVEIPVLKEVYHELDPAMVLLTVAVKSPQERVLALAKEHGIDYPVLLDENDTVMSAYKIGVIPIAYVIGPDGIVETVVPGVINSKLVPEAGSVCDEQCVIK